MIGEPQVASLHLPARHGPPLARDGKPSAGADVAVGVDYLIERAGGAEAVLREAAMRLPRVFRQANMLELTEAIEMALVDLAPDALEQLGDGCYRSLRAAATELARRASARLGAQAV
jgi:hypothetical protein